jgi:CheY-like chemotaxis protein
MRVLVVDDNEDGCTLLAEFVRMQGYEVKTAFTGPAALAAAAAWRPDAVLLDVGLPGLDGFEVARRFRADPASKAMKLVAVTGYGSKHDIEMGREAGFDIHLTKPVDLPTIQQVLASFTAGPLDTPALDAQHASARKLATPTRDDCPLRPSR